MGTNKTNTGGPLDLGETPPGDYGGGKKGTRTRGTLPGIWHHNRFLGAPAHRVGC